MCSKFLVTALLMPAALSVMAAEGIRLNADGWLFPLSRYADWQGAKQTASQKANADHLAAVVCKAGEKTVNIRSLKLREDIAASRLPDWEFSQMSLPAVIPPEAETFTLRLAAVRKKQTILYSFLMRGADGVRRTYLNKSLYSKSKDLGPLKFSELDNLFFSCRASKNAELRFGDLQTFLRGKAKLTAVPVADAFAVDHEPNEEDWKNAPRFSSFADTLKAPTTVKFLHDAGHIYVRFDQKTDTAKLVAKQNRDGQIWRDDSFQVLLSPGNDNKSYHQFVVNSAGAAQSYHHVFDQVADGYVRAVNLREKEWRVKVDHKAASWSAVFAVQKTFLDKYADESVHGLQILIDNRASGGGAAFFCETRRIFQLSEAGVLRLLSPGKPGSRPFPQAPALFFHRGKLLTGVPGKFEFRLACPAAKITGKGIEADNFCFLPEYTGASGTQRFTIWNDETGCIFAGKTEELRWRPETAYGTRILVPEPKKVQWSKEKTAASGLTLFCSAKTEPVIAERLTGIWSGFLQEKLLCKTADLPGHTVVIGKAPVPAELPQVAQSEGYALAVAANGVTIKGSDAAGLNHGVSTLEQLARYAMLRCEDFLPGVVISDWPDIPNRYIHRWIDACYWLPRKEFRPYADTFGEIKAGMYDFAYRFGVLNKFNQHGLQNPSQVIYETPDGKRINRPTSHMTLRELRDFAAFCRKHHFPVIPSTAGCSHANYLITNNFPQMILKGYGRGDADPTHPDYWKYLNAARGELIDAVEPKYFNTMNDEWWHYPQGKVELSQNGRPRREIFRETILKEHKFLTERRVRMIMCSDMLQPNHNGGKPFDNHLNLTELPRDIVMLNWSGNEPGVKLFTGLGYTVWGVFNLSAMGKLDPGKIGRDPKFQGIGCILSGPNGTPEDGYGTQSVITTAEEAWNFYSKKHTTMDDWLSENGAAALPMYSVFPAPAAGRTFRTVPLPGVRPLPAPFAAVPGGRRIVGFIPMEPVSGRGIRTGAEPVTIPVNAKASALIFLHSELVTAKPPIVATRRTRWVQGLKSAVYTIRYADGKTLDIYSRHGVNNGSALPRRGRVTGEVVNRFLHDVRYVWQLKNGNDPFFLFQWEWVNPRPEVGIKSISCRNLGDLVPGVEHYLFALTLRETNNRQERR